MTRRVVRQLGTALARSRTRSYIDRGRSLWCSRATSARTVRPRVLLVGPRLVDDNVGGGTVVMFERLLEDLQRRDNLDLTVVNTSRGLKNRGRFRAAWSNFAALVKTLINLWRHASSNDLVLWNVSSRGAVLGGPFVWLLCRWRQRPLFVRFFGGNLHSYLQSQARASSVHGVPDLSSS